MKSFLLEIKNRNRLLYWFGVYNLVVGILCIILMQFDSRQILGVSRWLKPMKFYLSVWIMAWSMAWLLYYLHYKKSVKVISWLIVVCMFIENFIIVLQSARGVRSHFNVQDSVDAILFTVMGIFISIFTFTVIYATWLFFRQRNFSIFRNYLWAIRLGLIFFVIFSLEGGVMLSRMSHTVGGLDGGPGIPVFNWSTLYGDLRIAHFLGMHSLQILPLAGFYVFKKPQELFLFAALYFSLVTMILITALRGVTLF
jgi:hypothetical protein